MCQSDPEVQLASKVTKAPPSDSSVIVGVETVTAQHGLGELLDFRETQSHGELNL